MYGVSRERVVIIIVIESSVTLDRCSLRVTRKSDRQNRTETHCGLYETGLFADDLYGACFYTNNNIISRYKPIRKNKHNTMGRLFKPVGDLSIEERLPGTNVDCYNTNKWVHKDKNRRERYFFYSFSIEPYNSVFGPVRTF